MRLLLIIPLLAVVVYGRPQSSEPSESDWKPVEEPKPQTQTIRYNSQFREFQNYNRHFIPLNFPSISYTGSTTSWHTENSIRDPRKKVQIRYKIANITSIKEQAKLNKNKRKRPANNNNKHWPDTEIQTIEDLNNYNKYVTTPPKKSKPSTQTIVTKVSENLGNKKNNTWHKIKLKPPFKQNTVHSQSSLPIEITENSNPFPVHIPQPTNVINSLTIPPNNLHVGQTINLTPESVFESDETRPANSADCPTISITNAVYNKEVCPDLDIVINNHLQTNTNVFTESPVISEDDFGDYEASPSDDNLEEIDYPENEPPEIEPSIEEEDPEPIEDSGLGESAVSSGTETQSSEGSNNGNRPQFPNLPSFPQNDNDNDNNSGGGILQTGLALLDLLNIFNYPLISLVVAPLTLILTGTLGLTTFGIPLALFPTVFLSRKAKNLAEPNLITKPDGWFWHTRYKTWANFNSQSRNDEVNRRVNNNNVADLILQLIGEFAKKYNSNINKSWKRRKK